MNRDKLFIFNPEHDMALANNDANYLPPAVTRQMVADLALLPVWYAGSNDCVLAPSLYNLSFLKAINAHFSRLPLLVTDADCDAIGRLTPVPWGWNPAIYKRLSLLGVNEANLPTQEQLNLIREKSHRLFAVELLKEMQLDERYCGESFYFTGIEDIRRFVESTQLSVLKAPLSGSGKGLNWCKGVFTPHIYHWCKNIISQQGGVVAEPLYNKKIDFALQFYIDSSGAVRFSGYSVFQTKATGAYDGNILAADEKLEEIICEYIPLELLYEVCTALEEKLSARLKGVYSGYLGVDMMICEFNDAPRYRVHPCVEVNSRMTMGMVARKIGNNFLMPDSTGIYKVDYFSSTEELKGFNEEMRKQFPLVIRDNKLISGYLPLVPVTPHSKYIAWVKTD